MTGSGKDWAK